MESATTKCARWFVGVVGLSLASPATADVLIVGPTTEYPDIQQAVDAAAPGDTVLVSPGIYTSFAIDKALTVIGSGPSLTTAFNPGLFGGHTALVRDLPAGQHVVISGFHLLPAFPATLDFGVVDVADCDGTVVLHNLLVDGNTANCAIRAARTAELLVSSVDATGNGNTLYPYPIVVETSTAWISNTEVVEQSQPSVFEDTILAGAGVLRSTLFLYDTEFRGADIDPPFFSPGGDGLEGCDAILQLVRSTLQGGQGFGDGEGGHGASLTGSSYIAAHVDSTIAGGLDGEGVTVQDPVELGEGSEVAIEPVVAPSLRVLTPAVFAADTVEVELFAAGGVHGVLLLSLGLGSGTDLDNIEGTLFLRPQTTIVLGPVDFDRSGSAVYSLPALYTPEVQGQLLVFQLLAPQGPRLGLSNPGLVTLL